MEIITFISVLITLSAAFSYVNVRLLKLPSAIGLILLGLILSLALVSFGTFHKPFETAVDSWVASVDFSSLLLNFMLGFMLFAGSMHVDMTKLMNSKVPIITYATLGVIISAFFVGTFLYYFINNIGYNLSYTECLLFGAIISPTDPIAATSMLKKFGIPKQLETEIVGESLLNDGVGVIMFVILMQIVGVNTGGTEDENIGLLILEEILGGVGLGLIIGYVGYRIIKSIDHYNTEILVTLAMVMGGYSLASYLHFSGALAMVAAGLFIGNQAMANGMSDITADYVNKFWELLDEIFNAILFVFIGLELVLISLDVSHLMIGLGASIIVLFARFCSVAIPFSFVKKKEKEKGKTIILMTWCGLRGGVSIALALAAAKIVPEKDIFVSTIYFVVIFSIIIQGLTIEPLMRRLKLGKEKTIEEAPVVG